MTAVFGSGYFEVCAIYRSCGVEDGKFGSWKSAYQYKLRRSRNVVENERSAGVAWWVGCGDSQIRDVCVV